MHFGAIQCSAPLVFKGGGRGSKAAGASYSKGACGHVTHHVTATEQHGVRCRGSTEVSVPFLCMRRTQTHTFCIERSPYWEGNGYRAPGC